MQGYSPKIHFRCRTSIFRKVCDELVSKFGEQFVERLREININQFLLLPSIPQNVPLVHMLLMQWDMSKECFVINEEMIKFTSEEVALLVGLPNRGLKFELGSGRISGVTANDIRHNIEEMDVTTPTEDLVKEFIVYLLSNIYFPMGNFRVPTGIEEVATNVDPFGTYNWPESIRDFLVKEFNSIADKHSKGFSLGYVNGFVHILIFWFFEHTNIQNVMDEQSRPRFTRWEGNFMYSEKEVNKLFADLKKAEIFPNFKAITEAERMLIDNSSTQPQIEQLQIDLPRQSSPDVSSRPSSPTPSSPPIIPTPSQIPTPYSPQRDPTPSQFTSPSSPPRIVTPSQIPTSSSPPRMPTHGQFPSTSHKEPSTVHVSNPPPAETPNWDSVNEAISNLISKNKFLLNKVTSLESSNDYLTRRVAALEQAVFELKEANLKDGNVQKLMSEENPASVKPTESACSDKSSSRTQTSKNIVSPSSVVAPNVVEEEQENIQDVINLFEPQTDKLKTNEEEGLADKRTGDSEEEELASTCKSGIARRVQLRHDRKRKFVSTPFTIGDRRRKKEKLPAKKKVILPIAEPSKEQVPVPVDAAPSKSAELGPVAAESIEVGAALVNAALDKTDELLPVDATPIKKTQDDQIIVTEIDESIPTDPQAAPEIIDYPGRELISVEKKFFIDKCLRYFKYRGDAIFSERYILICRSQIDELLLSEYLDNNHVDAFANLLSKSNEEISGRNQPFIYISSFHWFNNIKKFQGYYHHGNNANTAHFVSHVTRTAVEKVNLILVPIIHGQHWTLLISHLYEETQNAYDEDIRLWPTETIANVPTQANSVECGMYVCKYMETVIQLEQINWLDHTNWQDRMPIFRADFAYALFCTNMDLLTIT
ncbi:hypothetical protein M5K25_007190 [Dendrobium thyrsiflorum]|uniref:Ubiquitin-like protease family profile domain-containing protein n=1 Tax=Dendrobium thyrsiflorum TaxID=117978 RepID=A0ABD0VKM2_DENTH